LSKFSDPIDPFKEKLVLLFKRATKTLQVYGTLDLKVDNLGWEVSLQKMWVNIEIVIILSTVDT
jgi:hypothetical protein